MNSAVSHIHNPPYVANLLAIKKVKVKLPLEQAMDAHCCDMSGLHVFLDN
jgi:hypothetical protein